MIVFQEQSGERRQGVINPTPAGAAPASVRTAGRWGMCATHALYTMRAVMRALSGREIDR